jgi:hypothetical protein
MRPILLTLLAYLLLPSPVKAQEDPAIQSVIQAFFTAMQTGDTILLKQTCTEAPQFQTVTQDKAGSWKVLSQPFSSILEFVGLPNKDKYEEKITFQSIKVEPNLASVWTPYTFYINDQISHCGTNSFQLVKLDNTWKIQYIIDTRRRGCD